MKLEAQNITNIQNIRFTKDATDNINGVHLQCEVNMGKMGLPVEVNVYPHLTNEERQVLNKTIKRLADVAHKMIVTEELSADGN